MIFQLSSKMLVLVFHQVPPSVSKMPENFGQSGQKAPCENRSFPILHHPVTQHIYSMTYLNYINTASYTISSRLTCFKACAQICMSQFPLAF